MTRLATLTSIAALALGAVALIAVPASAKPPVGAPGNLITKNKIAVIGQSDHALFDSSADDAIYCGVELDAFVEPWTLHLTASAPSEAGSVTITFNDGDSITFAVAAGSSLSTSQSMGGVGGVTDDVVSDFGSDDLVRITADGGVMVMMASAEANGRAVDPFDEEFDDEEGACDGDHGCGGAEPDNFCITSPADSGVDWANANFPEHL